MELRLKAIRSVTCHVGSPDTSEHTPPELQPARQTGTLFTYNVLGSSVTDFVFYHQLMCVVWWKAISQPVYQSNREAISWTVHSITVLLCCFRGGCCRLRLIIVFCAVQSQEEFRQHVRECEEMKRQMEEDADREVLTLKTTYERRLQDEKVALHVRFRPGFLTTLFCWAT